MIAIMKRRDHIIIMFVNNLASGLLGRTSERGAKN